MLNVPIQVSILTVLSYEIPQKKIDLNIFDDRKVNLSVSLHYILPDGTEYLRYVSFFKHPLIEKCYMILTFTLELI